MHPALVGAGTGNRPPAGVNPAGSKYLLDQRDEPTGQSISQSTDQARSQSMSQSMSHSQSQPASADALAKAASSPAEAAPRTPFGTVEEEISAHLPMVRYLARRIHERLPSHVEMDDLVSAGLVGLMDAYQKFNPGKQVQFRSYAQFRVRGAILDSLRTLDWSPRELRRKGRAVEEAIQVLTRRWGRSPGDHEIATEMQLSLEQYQHLLGELKGLEIGTLNTERSEDSGEEEIAYLPNSPTDDPLFRCLKSEMHGRLSSAIEQLSERERLVLTLYYFEELTMKEIGATLGVVESRISQIHSSAVVRLRALLQAENARPGPQPVKREIRLR
jgi:RNA polymerase sigma factor for flagellar operon FliA